MGWIKLVIAVGLAACHGIDPEGLDGVDLRVDLILLTDATGSMNKHRREIVDDTIPRFRKEIDGNVEVQVMSFRDKPIAGFGDSYDYCVARHISFTDDWDRVQAFYMDPGLTFQGGGRESTEDSLTAVVASLQDYQVDSRGNAVPIVIVMTDSPGWVDVAGAGVEGLPPFNGHYTRQNCARQSPPSPIQVKGVLSETCAVLGIYIYDSPEGYHNYGSQIPPGAPEFLPRDDELDLPRRSWNQLNEFLEQPKSNVRDFKNDNTQSFLKKLYEQAASKYASCYGQGDVDETTHAPFQSIDHGPLPLPPGWDATETTGSDMDETTHAPFQSIDHGPLPLPEGWNVTEPETTGGDMDETTHAPFQSIDHGPLPLPEGWNVTEPETTGGNMDETTHAPFQSIDHGPFPLPEGWDATEPETTGDDAEETTHAPYQSIAYGPLPIQPPEWEGTDEAGQKPRKHLPYRRSTKSLKKLKTHKGLP